ncbi:AAA family ATPase [Kribbella sp. NPDC026596]|uniref:AAA family ATPase n=1 Tax=Kribbella sp. NPDC026596 TaxID=3155122 RepID=UPI0033D033D0
MGQVFGTPRRPAHTVTRTDRLGRAISLGDVLPESKAILFTGPPGMGKSRELDQAQELAARNGWTAIRVEASARDPLENRFTRAIKADLDKLRSRFGHRRVRKLRKTVRDLTQRARNTQHGAEVRVGAAPVQFIAKRQWDVTPQDDIGTTLNDFGDQLGELAASKDQPVLLLVDNVDAASPRDLAGLNELAVHLEQKGRPVWLVAAGGAMATSRLMAASDRMSGIATTVTNQFDIREVGPLSDNELRPFLTKPLDDARIGYQSAAIDNLLRAANGDPSRLRALAETALAYADRDAGITIAAAAAAASQVGKESVVLYQGRWNQCKDAQKDLLAKVAAQGPNGLSMPAETQAAGSGWREVDKARQLLVARGLLREHDGERVTIAEAGFQDWVNDYLEQTPAPAGPIQATQAIAQHGAGIAPAHPTGDRALVSKVFGTARTPVHPVDRVDQNAQPISLDKRLPTRTSVLFTGPPGMGTSHELDRAQALAGRRGWTAIRLDASPREPLENRVVRAVSQDMDRFRRRFGSGEARKLKKALGELAVRTRNAQHGAEVRVGVPGGFQVVGKRQWDAAPRDTVGSTLNELADHLGELAAKKGEPIMLMVDNLDVASDRDLVALTELSAHLERRGQPVFLVGAGGELATARLLGASGGQAGIETKVAHRFDVREVAPLTEAQLRPALAEPLRQAGIPYEAQAVDSLVKAANGNPSRLRALAGSALELADPQAGITAGVAKAATAQLNSRSRALYEAAWHNCSDAEKELLAKAAVRGPRGLSMPAESGPSAPGRWDLDSAGQGLISRGLLRRSGHHVTVADPGLQDWVQTRLGQSAAQSGIAHPTTPQPQLTSAAERPDGRHALTRDHGGRTINAKR